MVSPSLPVNSVQDLIALAKAKSGALTYASAGIGTPHQIFAELFKTKTGVDIRHVPYRGTVPGLTDVASGNVSMEFTDLTPALPLIQAGSLKILAVLSSQRNPEMPDGHCTEFCRAGTETRAMSIFGPRSSERTIKRDSLPYKSNFRSACWFFRAFDRVGKDRN